MDYKNGNGKGRHRRSQAYQSIFNEKLVDSEILSLFSNNSALYFHLNPYHYDERVLDLEDLLKKKLFDLLDRILTKRQSQIVELLKQGKTQQETALLLSCNQSSIVKSLIGSSITISNTKSSKSKQDKSNNKTINTNTSTPSSNSPQSKKDKVVYGGIIRKALKALEQDEEIQAIIKQLSELREDKW